jgi:hypothetical protein
VPSRQLLRSPFRSRCHALRIPLSGRTPWMWRQAQDQVTRMVCPPSAAIWSYAKTSRAHARRVIMACQSPFSSSLPCDVRESDAMEPKMAIDELR